MKTIDERVQELLKRGAFTTADLTDLLDDLAKNQVEACAAAVADYLDRETASQVQRLIIEARIT